MPTPALNLELTQHHTSQLTKPSTHTTPHVPPSQWHSPGKPPVSGMRAVLETLHLLFPGRPSIERSANNSVNSYNRYLAVASRVVRRSLKDDKRIIAERRGESELRFAKWSVS
jgi:hypothetical protein